MIPHTFRAFAVCLAFGSLIHPRACVGENVFRLTRDGEPVCGIVADVRAESPSRLAAAVLADGIGSVTGTGIATVGDIGEAATGAVIVLGEPSRNPLVRRVLALGGEALDDAGAIIRLARLKNGDQGFLVLFTEIDGKDCLLLCGNTPRGTYYAVRTLIERIYEAGDGTFVVDREPVVTAPAFKYRSLAGNLGGPDWLASCQFEKSFRKDDGTIDVKSFIDWLARYRINNLNVWMLDFMWGLAYDSHQFPEAVNRYHPNVRHEFFGELLRLARENYIDVWIKVNFPDRWLGVLRFHPELADERFRSHWVHGRGEDWWGQFYSGHDGLFGYGAYADLGFESPVCPNRPETMEFWRGYWDELLFVYPGIDGIGGQWCEHLHSRCQCDRCNENFFDQQWRYYKAMTEVAERRRPGLKYWIYYAEGAREIARRREEVPNLTYIGWGVFDRESGSDIRPPAAEMQGTRVDWYLSHGMTDKWYEPIFKKQAVESRDLGLDGIQKRMAFFRILDKVYFGVSEFAWDPDLSLEEFARRYVRHKLHIDDPTLARAYELELRIESAVLYSDEEVDDFRQEQKKLLKDRRTAGNFERLTSVPIADVH